MERLGPVKPEHDAKPFPESMPYALTIRTYKRYHLVIPLPNQIPPCLNEFRACPSPCTAKTSHLLASLVCHSRIFICHVTRLAFVGEPVAYLGARAHGNVCIKRLFHSRTYNYTHPI
jgi:hypothetical protein